MALMTCLVLLFSDRTWKIGKDLRFFFGLFIFLVIVLPWFIAINQASGGAFVKKAFISDLLPKLIGGQESHGAPPGFYFFLFPLLFWPGSLFALGSLWPAGQRRSVNDALRFSLAWIVPAWLMFELVPPKLPHYVLPAFPAIALATAHFLLDDNKDWTAYLKKQPFQAAKWFFIVFWSVITVVLAGGIACLPVILGFGFSLVSLVPVLAMILAMSGTYLFWRHNELRRGMLMCLLGSFLLLAPTFSIIFPSLDALWLSREIAQAVKTANHEGAVVAVVGYSEPSLVFYLGTDTTRFTGVEGAAQILREHPGSIAVVRNEDAENLTTAADQANMHLHKITSVRGYNYSKGKWLTMELLSPLEK
jgi:4-amino-4-deoxy-L-arabinose transferase-like glycosyltransferase